MESPQLVLCHKTERVTIFKIPPLATSKGYYLDDWKEMIWEGGVKVTEKNRIIKIMFIDKHEKLFGETVVPANYKQAIVKTNDSSRGYAVRLQNPKGGYLWVGVAFRDRNDAFDFGVAFQDQASRNKVQQDPNMLRQEFGQKVDFGLKKGEKVKISIGNGNKKQHKHQQNSSNSNPFDFGQFSTNVTNASSKPQTNNDWADFDFGSSNNNTKQIGKQEAKSSNNGNLIDFD